MAQADQAMKGVAACARQQVRQHLRQHGGQALHADGVGEMGAQRLKRVPLAQVGRPVGQRAVGPRGVTPRQLRRVGGEECRALTGAGAQSMLGVQRHGQVTGEPVVKAGRKARGGIQVGVQIDGAVGGHGSIL